MAHSADLSPTARPPTASLSGLTDDEARGFHGVFVMSFIGFTIIAIIAHFLVWSWRPWIPGVEGYPVAPVAGAPATGAAPSTAATVVAVSPR